MSPPFTHAARVALVPSQQQYMALQRWGSASVTETDVLKVARDCGAAKMGCDGCDVGILNKPSK